MKKQNKNFAHLQGSGEGWVFELHRKQRWENYKEMHKTTR